MQLKAKWIWKKQKQTKPYNQSIVAVKRFTCKDVDSADIAITADSYYRLYINGKWIADGPCRAWPEHYKYDQIDISAYLNGGENEIKVLSQFFGCGHFKGIPQRPGLLAQVDIQFSDGSCKNIVSDSSWEVATIKSYRQNVPKDSIQMSAFECYDANLEGDLTFEKAVEICDAYDGPWKDLDARDVALMTNKKVAFSSVIKSDIVCPNEKQYLTIPAARLLYPDTIEANMRISVPFGIATLITNSEQAVVSFDQDSTSIYKHSIDGIHSANGQYDLEPGEHLLMVFANAFQYHKSKDVTFCIEGLDKVNIANPLGKDSCNPWSFIPLKRYSFVDNDLVWDYYRETPTAIQSTIDDYNIEVDKILDKVKSNETFISELCSIAVNIPVEEMFVENVYPQLLYQKVLGDAGKYVEYDNGEVLVRPCGSGDIQLVYDLGEQNCGYYSFEFSADRGTVFDINSVEYISDDGRIQHAVDNCNGMRYVAKQGSNQYLSLKRRAGRYVLLTIRNQKQPVTIKCFELIESTYPVQEIGSFVSSDPQLNSIWDICVRTIKLCMEDTFTDCPLYEQTFWMGDARNEALFGYNVFGSTDIAARSFKIAAQSLDRYPIVGCQMPSSWDCLIPTFSCMWVMAVWEYYWFTGDLAFLEEMSPCIQKNLEGLKSCINEDGLFEGKFWNFFDWAKLDSDRDIVLHNSMFVVCAIDSAIKSFEVLETKNIDWLTELREKITTAVNKLWQKEKKAYPDSIHDDGLLSGVVSQHTSFLSVLFDIVDGNNLDAATKNMISPPDDMVRVGTPFTMMFLLEALDKLGMRNRILDFIYQSYVPMLKAGATTVWESFPSGTLGRDEFPTRSHCHAFSAMPLYFLPRIALGIRQTSPAGAEFQISPCVSTLEWAKGSIATSKGKLSVEWTKNRNVLNITVESSQDSKVVFVPNETTKGIDVEFRCVAR